MDKTHTSFTSYLSLTSARQQENLHSAKRMALISANKIKIIKINALIAYVKSNYSCRTTKSEW